MNNISLISWNILGQGKIKSCLFCIFNYLKRKKFNIICLQEMPDGDKYFNALLQAGYNIHRYNSNLIAANLPLTKTGRLELANPHHLCIWADIRINKKNIRIYNCHLAIKKIGPRERLLALNTILKHSRSCSQGVVIAGDMNTIIGQDWFSRLISKRYHQVPRQSLFHQKERISGDERFIFQGTAHQHGFSTALNIKKNTWRPASLIPINFPRMKLDWLLFKNLQLKAELGNHHSSDHRPIKAQLEIN